MGKIRKILEKQNKKNRYFANDWMLLKVVKPSEKTKKELNLPEDFRYQVIMNRKTGEINCDCLGYIVHKKCKHVEPFKEFFKSKIKNQDKNGKIREILNKYYQNQFQFLSFEPNKPVEIFWWGVLKETTLISLDGQEKEVVQLLVKRGTNYFIVTTASKSLLYQLSLIEEEEEKSQNWNQKIGVLLSIVQKKSQGQSGEFRTKYRVSKISNMAVEEKDKEMENLFLGF